MKKFVYGRLAFMQDNRMKVVSKYRVIKTQKSTIEMT